MKKLTAAIAATLFAAGVSASDDFDFHHGLADGNPDLSPSPSESRYDAVAGVQPSVGDSFDFHHGLAEGNSDLSQPPARSVSDSGDDPDIYSLFRGNPDLLY